MRGILWRAMAILAIAMPAVAQEPRVAKGSVETSLGGGATFPMGSFSDDANTGFNVSARAAYYVTDAIAIGGQGAYDRFGASDELTRLLAELASAELGEDVAVTANFDMLHFSAYGKLLILPEARAVPYVKAQIGWSTVKASGRAGIDEVNCAPPGCASEESWVSDLAMGAGIGLDFRFLEIFGAYAEAHYNTVFSDRARQLGSVHGGVILFVD